MSFTNLKTSSQSKPSQNIPQQTIQKSLKILENSSLTQSEVLPLHGDSRGWLLSSTVAPRYTSDRLRIVRQACIREPSYQTSGPSRKQSSFRVTFPQFPLRISPYQLSRRVTRDRRSRTWIQRHRKKPPPRESFPQALRILPRAWPQARGTVRARSGDRLSRGSKTNRKRGSDVAHAVASRRLNSRSASSIDFVGGGRDYGPCSR